MVDELESCLLRLAYIDGGVQDGAGVQQSAVNQRASSRRPDLQAQETNALHPALASSYQRGNRNLSVDFRLPVWRPVRGPEVPPSLRRTLPGEGRRLQ